MDFLKQAASGGSPIQPALLVVRLVAAFAMGLLAVGIYAIACKRGGRRPDSSFLATLVLLSLLIALVTVVIGDNVARAFSLVGTLAIVRFRTVVEDTRDTAFVIYAVACGMCAGGGYFQGALFCAPLVLAAAWLFSGRKKKPSSAPRPSGRLILRLSSAMDVEGAFKSTLDRVLPNHCLLGLATARGGSAMDATYAVDVPPAEQVYRLVNTLSAVDGVQGVEVKSE